MPVRNAYDHFERTNVREFKMANSILMGLGGRVLVTDRELFGPNLKCPSRGQVL